MVQTDFSVEYCLEPEFIQGEGSLLQGGIELRTGGSLGLACVLMIR